VVYKLYLIVLYYIVDRRAKIIEVIEIKTSAWQHNYLYVTGSEKTRHNSAFFTLHFSTQMYALTKFQLHIPKPFEVKAPESSSNRKIDLYRKINYRC